MKWSLLADERSNRRGMFRGWRGAFMLLHAVFSVAFLFFIAIRLSPGAFERNFWTFSALLLVAAALTVALVWQACRYTAWLVLQLVDDLLEQEASEEGAEEDEDGPESAASEADEPE